MSAEAAWTPEVVLYHDPCDDGFTAAWATWRRWPQATYLPAKYGQVIPCACAGKRVLLVDFSYKRDDMMQLSSMAHSVVVLDHHKTAEEELRPFHALLLDHDEVGNILKFWRRKEQDFPSNSAAPANVLVRMDMSRSGARLAWEFAHQHAQVPQLVQVVEDRDLWLYKYPHTRAAHMFLQTLDHDFEQWEQAHQRMEMDLDGVVETGAAVEKYYSKLVAEMVASRRTMELEHAGTVHRVPAVNCPGMFASDVGNQLLVAEPAAAFSVSYCDVGGGVKYSLRSEDSRTDVSAIAAARGGGGHRNAAGFFERS